MIDGTLSSIPRRRPQATKRWRVAPPQATERWRVAVRGHVAGPRGREAPRSRVRMNHAKDRRQWPRQLERLLGNTEIGGGSVTTACYVRAAQALCAVNGLGAQNGTRRRPLLLILPGRAPVWQSVSSMYLPMACVLCSASRISRPLNSNPSSGFFPYSAALPDFVPFVTSTGLE